MSRHARDRCKHPVQGSKENLFQSCKNAFYKLVSFINHVSLIFKGVFVFGKIYTSLQGTCELSYSCGKVAKRPDVAQNDRQR